MIPWRYYVRSLAGVFHLRTLFLAAAALLVCGAGEWLILQVAGKESAGTLPSVTLEEPIGLVQRALDGPVRYWRWMVEPFWRLPFTWSWMLVGVWRMTVWALVGVAIARTAAGVLTHRVQPTDRDQLTTLAAGLPQRLAPLLGLLLVIGLLLTPLVLHRWMLHVGWLEAVSAFLLPIPLVFALAAATLAVVLSLGWPLMFIASVVERPDPYDAASRSLAYVTQRPMQLAAYVLTALVVGAPVGVLVQAVAAVMARFGVAILAPGIEHAAPMAQRVAGFWLASLSAGVPLAYYAAYFWCAATATYLLLRRDVDGVQVDELDAPDAQPATDRSSPTASR